MPLPSSRTVLICCSLLYAATLAAQPGTGTKWEMMMSMPGMDEQMQGMEIPEGVQLPPGMTLPGAGGGGFMTQRMCMSKDTSKPPPPKEGCKILEQRSSGNHHFMKMQCPEGLMEMDQVRTATTLHADMKLTDKSGEVNQMAMDGRALGDCDYAAESGAQQAQVASVKRQIEDSKRQSDAQIKLLCDDAVHKMTGVMFGKDQPCAPRKKEFCDRLQTLDGYKLLSAQTDVNPQVAASMPAGHSKADQLKLCGQAEPALLARLCPAGARAYDFEFVHRSCPDQRLGLCDEAKKREEFWYIADHCDAMRAQLVAEQCAGRKYTAMIGSKYQQFCRGQAGTNLGATGTDCVAADDDDDDDDDQKPACPPPEDNKVKQGVKKGMDGLKKIFGN